MQKKIILITVSALAAVIAAVLIVKCAWSIFSKPSKALNKEAVVEKKPVSSQKPPEPEVAKIISWAQGMESARNFSGAKEQYGQLIKNYPVSEFLPEWHKKVESLNMSLLFSASPGSYSTTHIVQPGDNLIKIAKKYGTTVDLIKKINGLNRDIIIPGQKLTVVNAVFNLFADKSQNVLLLKSGDEIIKSYTVSTGKDNCTPVGEFKIVNKIKNPTWFRSGVAIPPESPENILGTRWMGFDIDGYGIHGTTEPEKLGQQVTLGCIRMANSDVEELYTIVPEGTKVTIID